MNRTIFSFPNVVRYLLVIIAIITYAIIFFVWRPYQQHQFFLYSNQTENLSWDQFTTDYIRRFHKLPPIGLKSWLSFAKRNHCPITHYYDAIYEDLNQYKDLIPLKATEVIEKAILQSSYSVAFQVKHGRLEAVKWRKKTMNFRTMKWLVGPLMKDHPYFPHPFVWNIHDGPADGKLPIFSSCQYSDWNDMAATNQTHGGVLRTTTRNIRFPFVDLTSITVPFRRRHIYTDPGDAFEMRKDKIVWRGSTTGPWGTGSRFRLTSRYGNATDFDVGFTRVVQDYNAEFNSSLYRTAEPLSYRELQQYKFILDLDGNSFTERFRKILLLGSVVLKQTQYREWHTERIQPWVDYIPISTSLNDISEKVTLAKSSVAAHGRETALHYLRPADQQCYMYRLLIEYGELFR